MGVSYFSLFFPFSLLRTSLCLFLWVFFFYSPSLLLSCLFGSFSSPLPSSLSLTPLLSVHIGPYYFSFLRCNRLSRSHGLSISLPFVFLFLSSFFLFYFSLCQFFSSSLWFSSPLLFLHKILPIIEYFISFAINQSTNK